LKNIGFKYRKQDGGHKFCLETGNTVATQNTVLTSVLYPAQMKHRLKRTIKINTVDRTYKEKETHELFQEKRAGFFYVMLGLQKLAVSLGASGSLIHIHKCTNVRLIVIKR
jgi:hypothetical protein